MELKVRNVNEAVSAGLWQMKVSATPETSRNGEVLVLPEPLTTTYERPTERVLFWPERDANPIFHLMESLWMLAGRDDLKFVEYFNSRMRNFSDDGKVLNGAYGHRWRTRFQVDQLKALIYHLYDQPDTRRAVLTMWTPEADLLKINSSKDVCCNTQCYFDLRGGRLNMTVLNRSNDMVWGAYGANAVHFSVLQEFIAAAIDAPVGVYRQFSNNMHLYTELYDYKKHVESPPDPELYDAYRQGIRPRPIMESTSWERWLIDCEHFCASPFDLSAGYYDSFFSEVARPMALVTKARKEKTGDGRYWAERIQAEDWRLATLQWIDRRENAKKG
jgi:hypothetical protein